MNWKWNAPRNKETRRPAAQTSATDWRLEIAARVTAVGALVGSLEELSRPEDMHDHGLFSWPVRRTGLRVLSNRRLGPLFWSFEHPRYQKAVGLRALTSAGVLLAPSKSRTRTTAMVGLSGLLLGKSYRSTYGSDGSDQMSFITTTVASAASLPGLSTKHRGLLSGFLAFQSTLSYFAAGVAKLRSPVWRDGSAITGILRTKTYGDEGLYSVIRKRPWAAKVLAWAVITAETAFPIVFFLRPAPRRFLLGLAATFHVGNARYMGLNRFFWAFLGTYPVVDERAEALQRVMQREG